MVYTRILVITVAYTTSHPSVIQMEYTMESLLAAACLHNPYHGANGPIPRYPPHSAGVPEIACGLHPEDYSLCHLCIDRRWRLMVRGGGHDIHKRPDSHLQLFRVLRLRLQHTATRR